jgi:hypothetical protein
MEKIEDVIPSLMSDLFLTWCNKICLLSLNWSIYS